MGREVEEGHGVGWAMGLYMVGACLPPLFAGWLLGGAGGLVAMEPWLPLWG